MTVSNNPGNFGNALKLEAIQLAIGHHYPAPIVQHAAQREHALTLYKQYSEAQAR